MKRMMKFGLALFFIVFVAPLWAHHAAEGIISDDIWAMIDENLQDADSPHLNIDFDDVMGSMRTGSSEDGVLSLFTTATVDVQASPDVIATIEETINELIETEAAGGELPKGLTSAGMSSGFYFIVEEDVDGYVQITLVEPIGQGESQDDMLDPPADPPGNRSGG